MNVLVNLIWSNWNWYFRLTQRAKRINLETLTAYIAFSVRPTADIMLSTLIIFAKEINMTKVQDSRENNNESDIPQKPKRYEFFINEKTKADMIQTNVSFYRNFRK